MTNINYATIRSLMSDLSSDHDADGEHRPQVGEVFAPEQHAAALAPSTLVVVGARGAGKSFWAGVLGQDETRELAAKVYPQLGLDRLLVKYGYNGFSGTGAVSNKTIEARVPDESDHSHVVFFWQIVILRAARMAAGFSDNGETVAKLMERFADPEDLDAEMEALDDHFCQKGSIFLIIFDALDTLAREWRKLTSLTDGLFEATWALRARAAIRAKIFIRPDQLNDEALRFVELPKLRSGRVELRWSRTDLYGLLYSRLADAEQGAGENAFSRLVATEGAAVPSKAVDRLRRWRLATDEIAQKRVMERLSGLYMGNGRNKGATYPWAYNHLADAKGIVTPRSFIKLFVEAAKYGQLLSSQALTAEGIRHGLREASKVRVEQLAVEYRWIKRALAPLAGLKVPCERRDIHDLWRNSNTVNVILTASKKEDFLPPFPRKSTGDKEELLEGAMERIGVLTYRPDGRVDMPDLFRIAARMFKLGGVALKAKI